MLATITFWNPRLDSESTSLLQTSIRVHIHHPRKERTRHITAKLEQNVYSIFMYNRHSGPLIFAMSLACIGNLLQVLLDPSSLTQHLLRILLLVEKSQVPYLLSTRGVVSCRRRLGSRIRSLHSQGSGVLFRGLAPFSNAFALLTYLLLVV